MRRVQQRAVSAIWRLAGLSLLVVGCSGFGGKVRVEVATTPNLNRDFPLAVDFVIAYDQGVFEELQRLPAKDWFDFREQYLKDFEAEVDSHYWEWVPGRRVEPRELRYKAGARGGVVFAHYFTPGEHRVVIEPLRGFILRLGETGFEAAPLQGR